MSLKPDHAVFGFTGSLVTAGDFLHWDMNLDQWFKVAAVDAVTSVAGCTGDVTGTATFDGTLDASIAVTVWDDDNKTLSVAYGNMVGLLIEAIKELTNKNNALETRIQALEAITTGV